MDKVLIDYAEVISRPFPREAMDELAQRVDMEKSEFERRYWEHRAPYDRGQASKEYWETVVGARRELDDETLDELVRIDVRGWLDLNPAAVEWLTRLADLGERPWLLSNAPHPLADAIDNLPIASLFEGRLFSARLGVVKPTAECFNVASEAMSVMAERILFIDDREANIDAAANLGMKTFLFSGVFPELTSINVK